MDADRLAQAQAKAVQSSGQAFAATISRITVDGVYAVAPSLSTTFEYGPVKFTGAQSFAEGDSCLLVFDESSTPWVVADGPTIPAPIFSANHLATQAAGVTLSEGNVVEASSATFTSASPQTIGGNVFTPLVNCWWRVTGTLIVQTPDAAWNRLDMTIRLSTADVRGRTAGPDTIASVHSSVSWQGYTPTALFKLAAGTTYTATMRLTPSTGNWIYYNGQSYLTLSSEVVGFY